MLYKNRKKIIQIKINIELNNIYIFRDVLVENNYRYKKTYHKYKLKMDALSTSTQRKCMTYNYIKNGRKIKCIEEKKNNKKTKQKKQGKQMSIRNWF